MKKKNLFLSALLLSAALTTVAQERITEYAVRPAVRVHMPLQGDSVNFKGDGFSLPDLLTATQIPLKTDDVRNLQRLQADTAGYVSVERPQEDNLVYLFSTRLRAERFMKATLKVSSTARYEVYVNGKLEETCGTSADSLPDVRPTDVRLRMEPEKDYEVAIKLLSSAEDKAAPVLKCELEKGKKFEKVACHIAPDLKRRLALYNTAFGNRVRSVALSPNGKYLLTTYSDNYAPNRSRTYRVLTEVKSGRTVANNLPDGARWMPRGNHLSYTVKGEQTQDLMAFDAATGTESLIRKDIPEGRFTWSPNEDYLIFTCEDEGEAVKGPLKRILMPDDRIPDNRGRSYLMKYDLATGLSERLTYGSQGAYLSDIAPDGTRLLCGTSRTNITETPYFLNSFFEIDLATLKADTLISNDGYVSGAYYSPDGTRLLAIGSPSAFGGIGKNCGDHPIANDYDTQAYLMDIATREVTAITRDFNPSVTLQQWNPTDGCIYFYTTDEDCEHIYRYTPKTGSFELLPLKEDVINVFSLAKENPAVAAYVGEGDYSVGVAYLYDTKKRTSTLLADPMAPTLSEIQLGKMEEWSFTTADGTRIKGQICLPPDFDASKKYPLIVYYYGGTLPTSRGFASSYSAQLFASRDYVVYVLQPSGTIGFGQEFSARHVNAWGDYTADEIIEGTRKFCEAHPFVDAKRIGCIGASYGGFMTQYLQTKTDLFAAAVSHAGISNVTSYWGEGYWGYSYNSVAATNSYPWTRPDLFTQHGSLFNADKINTPLLLLHGTADTNVPIGESIQLYNALKILGKTVEFVTVDGENHYISDYPKRELWHNTIMAWFARWLQDSPEWWNDLYPERHW